MADDITPARPSTRRLPGRLACPGRRASYQVSVYVDQGDQRCLVVTEQCRDEPQALHFALNMLVGAYALIVAPQPERFVRRMVWCELVPGRWARGRWRPDPRAKTDVDIAWLDSETGLITIDPSASIQRWSGAGGAW